MLSLKPSQPFSIKWIVIAIVGLIIFFTAMYVAAKKYAADVEQTPNHRLVDAENYPEFWLWTGVKGQAVLDTAQVIYLHQGEFALKNGWLFLAKQGLPTRKLNNSGNEKLDSQKLDSQKLINQKQGSEKLSNKKEGSKKQFWLTFRIIDLDDPQSMAMQIDSIANSWQQSGNQIEGIQLDFDAASRKLANYAAFLKTLRAALPTELKLSITGLLDWAKTGDVNVLNQLDETLDEVVIQTYQGRSTVKDYEKYLPALLKLRVPFKIGLVQNGNWDPDWQQKLAQSDYYLGEVIFLVNP